MEYGDEPDNAYLAKVLNEDIEKIAEARNSAMIVSVMSLNEQITVLSGEDTAQKRERPTDGDCSSDSLLLANVSR